MEEYSQLPTNKNNKAKAFQVLNEASRTGSKIFCAQVRYIYTKSRYKVSGNNSKTIYISHKKISCNIY